MVKNYDIVQIFPLYIKEKVTILMQQTDFLARKEFYLLKYQ